MLRHLAPFLTPLLLLAACGGSDVPHAGNSTVDYRSPIDSTIILAGNFGEPRPFHFHGGLDIKTQNREGWNVYAVADGYVTRLTVNKYGFGNAIYVAHPDGHTSVYCHLQRFADTYEAMLQRTGPGDTLSVSFPSGHFPVRAGDLIAISGNTGHSTGPHLHLEIHDTETWVMRDPMQQLGHLIADTVAPQAHSFMALPVAGEGVFNGSADKQTFGFGQPDTKLQHTEWTLRREFTAWGRVGFALCADDYSEATYNHYGIRSTRLLVDHHEVFRADVDSIPVSCQPEVHLWGDYSHWRRTRQWYMKSFRQPGMRLPLLRTGIDGGIITFDEQRPYHLTYILRDYQGNQSVYHFTVVGQPDSRITPRRRIYIHDVLCRWYHLLWPLHSYRTFSSQNM